MVARVGQEEPLVLAGIRSFWSERSYPRRVSFSWFVRATRGWTGHDAVVVAYVLDDAGHVVGRIDGCYESELRPERSWTCLAAAGMESTALASNVGSYDVVFTINERPVAWWPMEAVLDKDEAGGSDVDPVNLSLDASVGVQPEASIRRRAGVERELFAPGHELGTG